MIAQTWRTVDKADWPRGPWDDEPDKEQFTDEATGLPCLVKRNRMGALCGYVGVTEGHPWFGKDWSGVDANVHGGVTYGDFCEPGDEATTICHVPEPGEPDRVWWIGFDCAHSRDVSPVLDRDLAGTGIHYPAGWHATYRTLDYVKGECASLAAQAVEAAS